MARVFAEDRRDRQAAAAPTAVAVAALVLLSGCVGGGSKDASRALRSNEAADGDAGANSTATAGDLPASPPGGGPPSGSPAPPVNETPPPPAPPPPRNRTVLEARFVFDLTAGGARPAPFTVDPNATKLDGRLVLHAREAGAAYLFGSPPVPACPPGNPPKVTFSAPDGRQWVQPLGCQLDAAADPARPLLDTALPDPFLDPQPGFWQLIPGATGHNFVLEVVVHEALAPT